MSEGTSQSSLLAEIATLRKRVADLETDAVEHEKLRQLLDAAHSFRQKIIDHAAEGICVCHAVEAYPFVGFTVWNPGMVRITGYSMEDINRLGWYQTVYADPAVREKAQERMAKMRVGDDLQYERWEIVRADAKKRVLGISTSILTTNDGIVHVLGLMHDVTSEERERQELEEQVVRLEGLLPICAACKKIRDEGGAWHQVEAYVQSHSHATFTHSICPICAAKLYPEHQE